MNGIFKIVYLILIWISNITGFTYNEINIIAYFIITPFVYFYLLDKIIKKWYFKIGFTLFVIVSLLLIEDFSEFSDWLFDRSVDFLNWFEIIGWNYIEASVVICVFIPLLILGYLIYLLKRQNKLQSNKDSID
tara:strand:+ start:2220 stop:2618 length:399 start_codon:yes stop_codon:yes gene_type:complete